MTTHAQAKPAGTPTWVDLMAPDPAAARDFYRAVFGWDYDISGPEFGGYATARAGSRSAAGIGGQVPGGPPMPAAWNLYFASDDLEADVARATSLGAIALNPPMTVGAFGGMATCADPTGAVFSFWKAGTHVGAQVTDEPGATTWYELSTPDAKRARDFYAALLGMTAEPVPGGLEYYVLKRGDDMHCGIMQIDPARGAMPAMWVSYFAVADIDATVAAIKAHGGQIMGGIDDSPFGRQAACVDPAGGAFKVIQPPAG